MCDAAIIKGKKYVQVLFYNCDEDDTNRENMWGSQWDSEWIEYDTFRDCYDPKTAVWYLRYEINNYFAIQLFKHLRKLDKDGKLAELRQQGFIAVCATIGISESVSLVRVTEEQAQYWLDYENNRNKQ